MEIPCGVCRAGMRGGDDATWVRGAHHSGRYGLVGRLAAEDAARNGGLPLLDSFRVKDAPFAEKVKNEEAFSDFAC